MTDPTGRFMTARAEVRDAESKAEAILAASAGRTLRPEQIVRLHEIYRAADDAWRRMLQALQDMVGPEQAGS